MDSLLRLIEFAKAWSVYTESLHSQEIATPAPQGGLGTGGGRLIHTLYSGVGRENYL